MIITKFNCSCGANTPDAKYYDGMLGYEAVVCKKCGRYSDHNGDHDPDDWSKSFVGLEQNKTTPNDKVQKRL